MRQKGVVHWLVACFLVFSACLQATEDAPRQILSRAIAAGDLVKVQSLIDSFMVGIDELSEEYNSKSPLLEAASAANVPIIKYLVEKGACIEGASAQGYSPLVELIISGTKLSFQQLIETVRWLIDAGADVNGSGKNGYTPLMAACGNTKCLGLVEMLLDMGAWIDVQARNESTAYLFALSSNNVKAYRLLVSRGVNTNMTRDGLYPLSVLAAEGNIMMAKILIEEAGANVNVHDVKGTTPLIVAAIEQKSAMVQFLVEKGADINARTASAISLQLPDEGRSYFKKSVLFPKGCTALNFAKTMGWSAMIKLITELGGILYQEVEYKETTNYWR